MKIATAFLYRTVLAAV